MWQPEWRQLRVRGAGNGAPPGLKAVWGALRGAEARRRIERTQHIPDRTERTTPQRVRSLGAR